MSATTRYIVRACIAGVIAAAASLQAVDKIDGNAVVQAIVAGVVGLGLYLGVGAATPVEPTVGKKV